MHGALCSRGFSLWIMVLAHICFLTEVQCFVPCSAKSLFFPYEGKCPPKNHWETSVSAAHKQRYLCLGTGGVCSTFFPDNGPHNSCPSQAFAAQKPTTGKLQFKCHNLGDLRNPPRILTLHHCYHVLCEKYSAYECALKRSHSRHSPRNWVSTWCSHELRWACQFLKCLHMVCHQVCALWNPMSVWAPGQSSKQCGAELPWRSAQLTFRKPNG